MKITVLGSGGFGYPLTFCNCENCSNARKLGGKNIRKRASLLINDDLIIDLTPDTQTAMSMYNKDMSRVNILLQTHTHIDHFDVNHFVTFDYKYLGKFENEKSLVCSDLCLKDVHTKASMYEKMDMYDKSYLNKIKLNPVTINHGEEVKLGDYLIKAIHCKHAEFLGAQLYLIKQAGKTIFYATDTPSFSEEAIEELNAEKIDCVFLDESFGTNSYTAGHLNLKEFEQNIQLLRKKKILKDNCLVYATHITHDGNPLHDELETILNKFDCHASYDGQEIEL